MATRRPLDPKRELLEAFDHSFLATEYLVSVVPDSVWDAKPPGKGGRTIAGIVAHIQGVRRTFAKMGGAKDLPALDRNKSTRVESRKALRESHQALLTLFAEALEQDHARVKGLPRRVVNMMIYLVEHEAHHRGQITTLARELGFRLSKDDAMRIWGWKKIS